jgi:tRNA A37 threonylcarbamoyltransferase TsaD
MDNDNKPLTDISSEQRAFLETKIAEIEKELTRRMLNKAKATFAVVGFILTVGGLVTFSGIKDTILQKTVETLKNDQSIRSEVTSKIDEEVIQILNAKTSKVEELMDKTNSLIENERFIAQEVLYREFSEMRQLLEQIRNEYKMRTDTTTR